MSITVLVRLEYNPDLTILSGLRYHQVVTFPIKKTRTESHHGVSVRRMEEKGKRREGERRKDGR